MGNAQILEGTPKISVGRWIHLNSPELGRHPFLHGASPWILGSIASYRHPFLLCLKKHLSVLMAGV